MRIPRWEFKKGVPESDASKLVEVAIERKSLEVWLVSCSSLR